MITVNQFIRLIKMRTIKPTSKIIEEQNGDYEVIIEDLPFYDRRKRIAELKKQGYTIYSKGKYHLIYAIRCKNCKGIGIRQYDDITSKVCECNSITYDKDAMRYINSINKQL